MGGRLRALVPEDRATLESDPSADTRAIQRAGTERSCPFGFCPLFWWESEKLKLSRRSVIAMGDGILHGLTVEVLAISAPGMVGGRRFGCWELAIEGLAVHDLRLVRGCVVDSERERGIFV